MAVVNAWLNSDQSLRGFAKAKGVDLYDLMGWIMEYAQSSVPSRFITVRILDEFVGNHLRDTGYIDYCPRPNITLPRVAGRDWVPVVIQERT
jgi:hypothetical protein